MTRPMHRSMHRVFLTLLACVLPATAAAQPSPQAPTAPPSGPAEIIQNAQQAEEAQNRARAQQAAARANEQDLVARRAMGQVEPVTTARSDQNVPAGTIVVSVFDANRQPVAGANVELGILASMGGGRDKKHARTDAAGVAQFQGLATGTGQAYRVTVPSDGARYGSVPFRLEPDRGHMVQTRLLPTTRSTQTIVLYLGQTMLELKEERLHVTQEAQIANIGGSTIVFGEEGALWPLPAGFTAFQSQEIMTDQRIVPDDDGFRIKGSLPPGRTTLTWAYDLPIDGGEIAITQKMPFRTFQFRLIADAATGMTIDVDDMPAPETVEVGGRRAFITGLRQQAGPFTLRVRLEGIPGPGPLRWVAVGAAMVLLFVGLMWAFKPGDPASALSELRDARREELLDRVAEMERAFAANEIGPKYHAREMEALVAELATLLRQDATAKAMKTGAGKRR